MRRPYCDTAQVEPIARCPHRTTHPSRAALPNSSVLIFRTYQSAQKPALHGSQSVQITFYGPGVGLLPVVETVVADRVIWWDNPILALSRS